MAAIELIKKSYQIPGVPGADEDEGNDYPTKRQLLGNVNAPNALGMGVPITVPIEVSNSGGILTNEGGILNSKEGILNGLAGGKGGVANNNGEFGNNALQKVQANDLLSGLKKLFGL